MKIYILSDWKTYSFSSTELQQAKCVALNYLSTMSDNKILIKIGNIYKKDLTDNVV
jgi:hypothetical protein